MVKRTTSRRVVIRMIVFSLILFSSGFHSRASFARETAPSMEHISPPKDQSSDAEETDSLWRAALWEAIPQEYLRDPGPNVLLDAYAQKEWKPLFFNVRFQISPDVALFLQRLEDVESEAIDPAAFPLDFLKKRLGEVEELRTALESGWSGSMSPSGMGLPPPAEKTSTPASSGTPSASPTAAPGVSPVTETYPQTDKAKDPRYGKLLRLTAEMDVRLAECLVRYAREMNPFSQEIQGKVLAGQISMADFLRTVAPSSPHYATLKKALARYRDLAAQQEWHRFHASKTLRQGDSGPEVASLQKRLAQEGFYTGKASGHFDHATTEAVRRFQRYHLIEADGTVGQRTREWLNVPYDKKAQLIRESMRQLRQSRSRPYDRFVRINIPQFLLEYYREGKIQAEHRVIVGKAAGKKIRVQGRWIGENQTPSVASVIEQVVFNPRWYVSDRIRRELSDEIAADPRYLEKHGYVKMSSNYPWGEPRLFQLPGPTNPLGRVKFEFSNAYAIFLHDTPKKQLFQRAKRDFSHGCIRVEKAWELAQTLLADDQNPAVAKTESFLENYNRQAFVRFNQPIPIIIEYIPATSDGNGQVVFCGDLYGWFVEEETQRS
ncbi:MAG: L,D-transpeptidase family protein [Syntrophobacteraceae bacterium]|nr:L,D-transpeptidase family protein [Syntrophobacteraceae bacterium]